MSHNIEHVFYINLEKRKDRREQIEAELVKYDIPFERFEAIERSQGILGCGLSHMAVFKLAKERGYKNVLIFEDDFTFLSSKQEVEEELTKFFDSQLEYDICMLAYNVDEDEPVKNCDFVRRILVGQSAAAYIVNCRYYDTLIALFEWAMPLLEQTKAHWTYDGFSDNAQEYMVYNC
jgi:glycosyl transferase family 25